MQLDIINAFCSVCRQVQFDVLAEKASTSYYNGNMRDGDMIPGVPSLRKYWGYFQSMQGHTLMEAEIRQPWILMDTTHTHLTAARRAKLLRFTTTLLLKSHDL